MLGLTEDQTMYCPLCGRNVTIEAGKCPVCGASLDVINARKELDMVIEGRLRLKMGSKMHGMAHPIEEGQETLPIDSKPKCPACASDLSGGESTCPWCGVPLAGTDGLIECPRCGSRTQAGARGCPICGVEFVEAPEPPVPLSTSEVPVLANPPELTKTEGLVTKVVRENPAGEEGLVDGGESPVPRGLVNGTGTAKRTGFVNGTGLVNGTGMVKGHGAINGTGLVNGTGITNGTKAGARLVLGKKRGRTLATRWQFLSVLIVLVVVVSSFIYLSYASERNGLTIDGRFNDWSHVSKFTMNTAATSSTINVDQWAVRTDDSKLYLYLRVQGALMGSSNVDSFYLFLDSDNSARTGYAVSSLGADYMLEIDGWNSSIQSAALNRYGSATDQHNWTSWTNIGSLSTALGSSQLEAMADLSLNLGPDSKYLLLSQNALDQQSISYVVPKDGGTLVIHQEAVYSSMPNGVAPFSSNLTILKLGLLAEGVGGTVQDISPAVIGADLVGTLGPVTLKAGEERTLEVRVSTSASTPGSLMSVSVSRNDVASDFADVSIIGDPAKAYIVASPTGISIDGAFGDWAGRITLDTDSLPVNNPDININATGAVNTTQASYFYVSVKGQICDGSFVPSFRTKPTGGSGSGGVVIPTRITGEDLLRLYIDSDLNASTGMPMTMSSKVIGADHLLEVVGTDGVIDAHSLMVYQGGVWTAVPGANVSAANDAQRMEIGVASAAIGGGSSIDFIIMTTDWRGRWDMATSVPQAFKGFSAGAMAAGLAGSQILSPPQDPWVINAQGITYMSSDGSAWSYLGAPTLVSGDRVVDIAMTLDGADAFLVTNTGRTYYWTLGTSTNWTAGETIPIDNVTYSDAVSMSFYSSQGASAWLLTKSGSYFWLQNAHKSTKAWTYQSTPLVGYTDYTDLVYAGGTMYALRSGQNTSLNFSANGNSFTSVTSPTGSTSKQVQSIFLPMTAGSSDDVLYVLCENGNIRHSSNGGSTWSALGNLPVPSGANTSRYVALGIDPSGYMWVVTNTGYTFKSTDTTTFSQFTCTGKAPISGIVAILPTTVVIPEFPALVTPLLAMMLFVGVLRVRLRRTRKARSHSS